MTKKRSGPSDSKTNNGKGNTKTLAEDDGKTKGKGAVLKAATSINVRHILCEKYSKATEARERIEEGQAFDKVAKEYSEDKAKVGGSLGWMTRADLVAAFRDAAFALEPSAVGKPIISPLVRTSFGYHTIMVEGRR